MKISIVYKEGRPFFSVLGFEGVMLVLVGRVFIVVSKDPNVDPISDYTNFFLEKGPHGWKMDFQSNYRTVPNSEIDQALKAILSKANDALSRQTSIDLSEEFNALDNIDPYYFEGLYTKMNDKHFPIRSREAKREMDEMREKLKLESSLIDGDEHILCWLGIIEKPIIWKDET